MINKMLSCYHFSLIIVASHDLFHYHICATRFIAFVHFISWHRLRAVSFLGVAFMQFHFLASPSYDFFSKLLMLYYCLCFAVIRRKASPSPSTVWMAMVMPAAKLSVLHFRGQHFSVGGLFSPLRFGVPLFSSEVFFLAHCILGCLFFHWRSFFLPPFILGCLFFY
jgi:hypothetical protein